MTKRSSAHISTLIIFLSILTIIVQYLAYYLIAPAFLILGISALICILCNHILIENSNTYYSSFSYTALCLFVSLVITILTYYGQEQSILFYTPTLFAMVVVNWLIPTAHGFFHNMFQRSPKTSSFHSFYRNNSIIFLLYYVGIIIYALFLKGSFPWPYPIITEVANSAPFLSLAVLIERYIMDLAQLKDIFIYLASRVLLFVPYGFYISILLRNNSRLLRVCSLILFPLGIEFIQYLVHRPSFDIDDIIYGFLGSLIGFALFVLTNYIFRTVSGRDFLSRSNGYGYSNLHF